MNQSSISIRAARPSVDEGVLFARYLDIAAEGFFKLLLGKNADDIIGRAFVEEQHNYSYQNVLFAELDNKIVGMAAGFTGEDLLTFTDKPLRRAAGLHVVRLTTLMVLFAPMLRILNTVPTSDFYLLGLATDENMRGRGVGSTLIDAMEKRAVSSGSARIALDVSDGNTGARALYERRGMSIESQWPKRLDIPKLRFFRMVKSLDANG